MEGQSKQRQQLLKRMRTIEQRSGRQVGEPRPPILPTGWGKVDAALGGGLRHGAVHEWFAPSSDTSTSKSRGRYLRGDTLWTAPLCLLAHLAWQTLQAQPHGTVVWIGASCLPYPRVLCRDQGRDRRLLLQSLFVGGHGPTNLWAIDLALRNPAVAAVIADGSGLDMAATRRLQLAAEAGGTMALLARPTHELGCLSAADTRWRVHHRVSDQPAWTIELLRSKSANNLGDPHRAWNVQWDAKAGLVVVSADVVDRSAATTTPSPVARQDKRIA